MPHLINITVEVDTEYESEARRLSHEMAEDLSDYGTVAVAPPQFIHFKVLSDGPDGG